MLRKHFRGGRGGSACGGVGQQMPSLTGVGASKGGAG